MRRSCSVCARCDLPLRGFVEQLHELGVDRHHDARPACLGVQPPGDGEHGVADLLGRQPAPAEMPEQAVLRVDPLRLRRDRRPTRLAVGVAQHDQPMERLEPPAVFHERCGQPVEQLRVAGTVSLGAEVVHRLHQSQAEVLGPDPIDEHPRRKRMLARREPPRQSRARIANIGRQFGAVVGDEDARGPGADRLALVLPDPPPEHVDLGPPGESFLVAGIVGGGGGIASSIASISSASRFLSWSRAARIRLLSRCNLLLESLASSPPTACIPLRGRG